MPARAGFRREPERLATGRQNPKTEPASEQCQRSAGRPGGRCSQLQDTALNHGQVPRRGAIRERAASRCRTRHAPRPDTRRDAPVRQAWSITRPLVSDHHPRFGASRRQGAPREGFGGLLITYLSKAARIYPQSFGTLRLVQVLLALLQGEAPGHSAVSKCEEVIQVPNKDAACAIAAGSRQVPAVGAPDDAVHGSSVAG